MPSQSLTLLAALACLLFAATAVQGQAVPLRVRALQEYQAKVNAGLINERGRRFGRIKPTIAAEVAATTDGGLTARGYYEEIENGVRVYKRQTRSARGQSNPPPSIGPLAEHVSSRLVPPASRTSTTTTTTAARKCPVCQSFRARSVRPPRSFLLQPSCGRRERVRLVLGFSYDSRGLSRERQDGLVQYADPFRSFRCLQLRQVSQLFCSGR